MSLLPPTLVIPSWQPCHSWPNGTPIQGIFIHGPNYLLAMGDSEWRLDWNNS